MFFCVGRFLADLYVLGLLARVRPLKRKYDVILLKMAEPVVDRFAMAQMCT